MRALVFLLILANLFFFAWTEGYFGASTDPDALRLQQQLLADQVTIVARDEPPVSEVKAHVVEVKIEKPARVPEKKAPESCLLLSDLPVAEMVRIERLLADKFDSFRASQTMSTGSGSFWVFIPPLASKQDAERKAGELKALRVPEIFIVQEPGPNRFAISLGIFSSKEAASERLAELREKGVRSAKVGERDVKPAFGSLEIQGPEVQADGLRQALTVAMPKTRIAACKAPAAATQ
ncbi:MAG: SPOR domain-containing protein [Betaproteobacteria bacterium]